MDLADRSVIEHFVRHALGCRCPDEVFESIAVAWIPAPGAEATITRLVVGDRLLIYIVDAGSLVLDEGLLGALGAQGRSDRDLHGFNRFRLVIASKTPSELAGVPGNRFASVVDHDDRAHLHALALDQLPESVRPRPSSA